MSEAASEFEDFKVPILISDDALTDAINWVIGQKVNAIDRQDFETAAEWRDEEKKLRRALGGHGLLVIEKSPNSELDSGSSPE